MSVSNQSLNGMFTRIRRRSEQSGIEHLTDTFVNAGILMEALSNEDHQIIYGRRGTGKTHALRYLASEVAGPNGLSLFIDMSQLGSDSTIYNDTSLTLKERAARLLVDVLNVIHDGLLTTFIDLPDVNFAILQKNLDSFSSAMPKVQLVGPAEVEVTGSEEHSKEKGLKGSLKGKATSFGFSRTTEDKGSEQRRKKVTGNYQYRVAFPGIADSISQLVSMLPDYRLWVMIDEWSSLPEDIQPYLADMIRRAFFHASNVTVKIASIEHRSNFYEDREGGQYLGFELGSDIGLGANLDDYLVFENNESKSKAFYAELLHRHLKAIAAKTNVEVPSSPEELVRVSFTQERAFVELIRACEGVPRDAIYIIALAAQKSGSSAISIPLIRQAARDFYETDKSKVITSSPMLAALMNHIIGKVIGKRTTANFLIEVGQRDSNINRLFDRRILHVKSRNESSRDHRGIRFLRYKIDYGCYIDLIHTKRFPKDVGLDSLQSEDLVETETPDGIETAAKEYPDGDLKVECPDNITAGVIEVPKDDGRSYRRAVLNLAKFYEDLEVAVGKGAAQPDDDAEPQNSLGE